MSSRLDKKFRGLPEVPGVYLFKNKSGAVIYIGKAGSLKRRVLSYFQKAHDIKTEALLSEIFDLDFLKTPSAIEALILESELIKKYSPKYNIREKDNKSFIYVCITKEDYPKPILIRGHELNTMRRTLSEKFGPFTSGSSLREALKILRRIFPWSECKLGQGRPCFYYGIKTCPGICVDAISKIEYRKNINNLILFFKGKRMQLLKKLEREMREESKKQNFERAQVLRNRIYALNHIRDISLIKKEEFGVLEKDLKYNVMGRIEGYDISNISGKLAVGSMAVFYGGEPQKSEYKKFRIKNTMVGDVPMLREVLSRRFKNNWRKPDIILIDGGMGQVNIAKKILKETGLNVPVIGIAKGLSRKNDRFVYDKENFELERVVKNFKNIFKHVRDEAHRFAIRYHRSLRKIKTTRKRAVT